MTIPRVAILAQLPTLESETAVSFGLLIVGIVFISAWLLMRIRKRSQHGPDHPTAREHIERYRQHDGVKNDLEGLMVEIEQLAKRLGSQLDAKSIQIEKLIDDADLRIAQLQQAMKDQHSPPSPEFKTPPSPESQASSAGSAEPVQEQRDPAAQATDPTEPSADPLANEVHRLADAGQTPPQIAKQLGEHVGKVELILALRQS